MLITPENITLDNLIKALQEIQSQGYGNLPVAFSTQELDKGCRCLSCWHSEYSFSDFDQIHVESEEWDESNKHRELLGKVVAIPLEDLD